MTARAVKATMAAFALVLVPGGAPAHAQSAAPAPGTAARPASDTAFAPEVLALGQRIFLGKAAGGLCFTCHGENAKGKKKLGPNLTDAKWLHGDGSYEFIVHTIETGIPKPKDADVSMPWKGGAQLTPADVRAVAAYVYSLRQKVEGRR